MSAGRPLSFNPEQALGRATDAFWAQGYEASSLQDLLEATGLSKSSLYQQFGNKQQLFDRCLEHYTGEMEQLLLQLLQCAPSGRALIQMVLTQVISETQPARGCLIFNTGSEFGQGEPQVAERVRQGLGRFRGVFLQALQQDQAAGLLGPAADVEALADYLMTCIGGLRTMVKTGADTRAMKSTVAIILQALT